MTKTISLEAELIDPQEVKQELLSKYPTKVARKRAKQIIVNEVGGCGEVPEIGANIRTIPGIITQRGCTYAGCKGVILGPTRDIVNITHGPIGCGFYSWLTRRNQTRPPAPDDENFMTYCFSTDMQEEDIVFGGEKKLRAAIQEAYDLFHPKAISIFATCPVGLIGDDVHAVAREMKEKLGINVFGFSCEGYKGVSQSAGHHIANNGIFTHVVGLNDNGQGRQVQDQPAGRIQHRRRRLRDRAHPGGLRHHRGLDLQRQFDLRPVCQRPHGRSQHRHVPPLDQLRGRHDGDEIRHPLDQGQLHRGRSHRQIAAQDRRVLRGPGADGAGRSRSSPRRCRKSIQVRDEVRARCEGKMAMLFVGGSRAHHYQELFREIGMKTISAGYEFAHRDDYEGRKVLPGIKVDADSRNIEELEVEPDPERFRPRKTAEEMARLQERRIPFQGLRRHDAGDAGRGPWSSTTSASTKRNGSSRSTNRPSSVRASRKNTPSRSRASP